MSPVRVGVICGHPMGLPAIGRLQQAGCLAGLATSVKVSSVMPHLEQLAASLELPLPKFHRATLDQDLPAWIEGSRADLVMVTGFDLKIPGDILKLPRLGFLNFHAGLLPRFRGPQPEFWEIRRGEPEGGVTVFQMDEGWDTGPVVAEERIPILPNDTAGLHAYKLGFAGAKCCERILGQLASQGTLAAVPQDEAAAAYQGRPDDEDLTIAWSRDTADSIKALVRAANPSFGGAAFGYQGVVLRLLQASVVTVSTPAKVAPGTIVAAGRGQGILVHCVGGKQLRLDVLSGDIGIFSGSQMVEWFNVEPGVQLQGA